MSTETTEIVNETREVSTPSTEVNKSPFEILSTEPEFASEKKEITAPITETTVTKTAEELANEKQIADAQAIESAKHLAEKAKGLGLDEKATTEQIAEAEKKSADELKAKATELGLPVTATKEEVDAKIKAKEESNGFVTPGELETGILGAEDGTWKALALAKGYEVPEDFEESYEAFIAIDNANWEKKIQEAETKGRESAYEGLKPEVRAALEMANQIPDLSIEEVLSPTIKLDSFLKLGKEELIREEIKASNPEYTEEMVDIEMQRIKDNKQEDTYDQMIRLNLNKQREQIQGIQKQRIQEYQAKSQEAKVAAEKSRIDQVSKVLDRDLTFLDKKLTDIDRQYLRNKINEGAINSLLNNPEKLARAIMMDEFYDKGIKSYENRVRERLLVDQKKSLHNVPHTNTSTQQNTVVVQKPIDNQWDILKDDFGVK